VAKSSDDTKVTRIKAKDDGATKKVKSKPANTKQAKEVASVKKELALEANEKRNVFQRLAAYFKGSWQELTMVRWPDRKTTWKMTGALIVFTVAFGTLILLLDYLFQYVFKLLIGK
jgi:preprotein translocase SecE subunit